jgi:multidrug efflux pump subunit AcrA (membrane-fusion protein)
MKKSLTAFFNKPYAVAVVSVIIAAVVGIFGYSQIHKAPVYAYATANAGVINQVGAGASQSESDLTLGFVTGGRIGSVNVKEGDTVKKGEILASLDAQNIRGSLTQAQAAYAAAEANYQKIINGATGSAIDVAKAALNTAQVNLDQATATQATLVTNAHRTLLNSTFSAQPTTDSNTLTPPTISGTYTGDQEGTITITAHSSGNTGYVTFTGLVSGTANMSSTTPQQVGTTGLSILFPTNQTYNSDSSWTVAVPNTLAANYLSNSNAYQQALQTQSQVLAQDQAAVDQAQATLTALVTTARPEDVAAAKAQVDNAEGAVEIAQGAYSNTIITAPGNGTVTAVSITPGQIAMANAAAIELYGASTQKTVAIMIPNNAVVSRNGQNFVEKKTTSGIVETAVTLGAADDTNVEVLTGLSAGDMVVTH